MSGEILDSREMTPDEAWAERAIEKWRNEGFYADVNGMKEIGTDEWTFYALVMPQQRYDALLAEINAERQRRWEIDVANFNRRSQPEPYEILPWEVFSAQPTFVGGMETRQEALLAAAEPFMKK